MARPSSRWGSPDLRGSGKRAGPSLGGSGLGTERGARWGRTLRVGGVRSARVGYNFLARLTAPKFFAGRRLLHSCPVPLHPLHGPARSVLGKLRTGDAQKLAQSQSRGAAERGLEPESLGLQRQLPAPSVPRSRPRTRSTEELTADTAELSEAGGAGRGLTSRGGRLGFVCWPWRSPRLRDRAGLPGGREAQSPRRPGGRRRKVRLD